MEIVLEKDGDALLLVLAGRLDVVGAPKLQAVLEPLLTEVKDLSLDLQKVAYISSAGLRVILLAQKRLGDHGTLRLLRASEPVLTVFRMAGLIDVLRFE